MGSREPVAVAGHRHVGEHQRHTVGLIAQEGLSLLARTRLMKVKTRSLRNVARMPENERIVVDYQCIEDGRDRHQSKALS
ncbi:hypothetical protein NI18_00440 [Sphingomonas sp. Ant20]|nr:hypothetical protein NI18_00440 [Sphingomonas sp. Ant20]